ncbi:uncharacterized protein LOC143214826 [Lasioglossum baleicum]|uniref:uncharacterized protein LOC143214826 n=1 Tax=Lasioglossum baleicum TaxID=434251 RepID=UPI003FCE2807
MIQIIQKIVREMQPKKRKCFKFRRVVSEISDEESSMKIPTEDTASGDQKLESLELELTEKEEEQASKNLEDVPQPDKIKKLKDDKAEATDEVNKREAILIKKIESFVPEVYPRDNCFFWNPNIVAFDDIKAGKKYSKRVHIVNKTSKWAYLRFNKIYTDIWEPGIVEIDIMDAARVQPGMHSTINVKFSPIYDGKVTAEISFLTLSPDNTKTFHEFRVPVICKPETSEPVLDPAEIRFPAAPAWRFDEPKFGEKMLTVSNEGRKSFSIFVGERDDRSDCFLWHFDQAEMLSARFSVLSSSSST